MSRVINLRTIRKQRGRDASRRAGAEAAALSGETRGSRAARSDAAAREIRHLDQHRRETGDGTDDQPE